MIQELAKLHEHVGVDGVRGIRPHHDVGADDARTWKP